MQYALLIYAEPAAEAALTEPEEQAVRAEFATLAEDPRYLGGARLQPASTASSVRVVDGRALITDGPFADTKEVIGGVAFIEAADLEEAVELAAAIPAARLGATVEVRAVLPR